MKKSVQILVVILLTCFCFAGKSNAQKPNAQEITDQKNTQIKYLIQQIAALLVYIEDAEKGYRIVEDGLHTIGNIKNGEFNLHSLFFSSLESINPSVKKMGQVAEILLMQAAIVETFKNSIAKCRASARFSGDEMDYITRVYTVVTDDCTKDIDALITVISSGNLKMTDDERIGRINDVYGNMQKKYVFTNSFTAGSDKLSGSRTKEAMDIKSLMVLYGIQ